MTHYIIVHQSKYRSQDKLLLNVLRISKPKIYQHILLPVLLKAYGYSRTLMARTSFGPWKFVLDMGSSSHRGLIIAPGQEANEDNLGMPLRASIK